MAAEAGNCELFGCLAVCLGSRLGCSMVAGIGDVVGQTTTNPRQQDLLIHACKQLESKYKPSLVVRQHDRSVEQKISAK